MSLDDISPRELFGGVSDETWLWLHLEGRERCPFLAGHLPSLPAEKLQARMVGTAGAAALNVGFQAYQVFKKLYEEHRGRPLRQSDRLLDFGCGWGRVIRFFLKDVEPDNLWGVDVKDEAVSACRETNRWCRFHRVDRLPPSEFSSESFDLVFAFSVYSHLSEEAHERWLDEFARILRPEGVLLLTTFPRDLIEQFTRFDWNKSDTAPLWQQRAAECFSPAGQWLAAYDRGEFCFSTDERYFNPHFGFACIPESYVRRVWSRHFVVREYFPSLGQNLIVCKKGSL